MIPPEMRKQGHYADKWNEDHQRSGPTMLMTSGLSSDEIDQEQSFQFLQHTNDGVGLKLNKHRKIPKSWILFLDSGQSTVDVFYNAQFFLKKTSGK